jgi:Uma2 family endonuclease
MQPDITREVVATDVTFDDYLERYAADHCEWVDGTVVKLMPIEDRHDDLYTYLRKLFEAYFDFNPIAFVRAEPWVMKLPTRGREPDLMIIMNDNPHPIHKTHIDGPADIVVEILSPGNEGVDLNDKFREYEQGGVREYWMVDHRCKRPLFYRRNEEGLFMMQLEDDDGNYTTPLLPKFKLHVPTLWQEKLPGILAVVEVVRQMWEAED